LQRSHDSAACDTFSSVWCTTDTFACISDVESILNYLTSEKRCVPLRTAAEANPWSTPCIDRTKASCAACTSAMGVRPSSFLFEERFKSSHLGTGFDDDAR